MQNYHVDNPAAISEGRHMINPQRTNDMTDVNVRADWDEQQSYERAVGVIITHQKVSSSYIQRRLGIGYNKAKALVERAEAAGIVTAPNYVGKREVLFNIPPSI
jgi:S-DNA-T family DNA segregation ATPase FtsK/SpoIIIE